MAKHKKGDRVKVKGGKHGVVQAVHSGTFYHVAGLGFFPPSHVEPEAEGTGTSSNPDPDHDGDNDMAALAYYDGLKRR